VDNERTGKALLERGGLTKRITIIPLNKVGGWRHRQGAGCMSGDACTNSASVLAKSCADKRKGLSHFCARAGVCVLSTTIHNIMGHWLHHGNLQEGHVALLFVKRSFD